MTGADPDAAVAPGRTAVHVTAPTEPGPGVTGPAVEIVPMRRRHLAGVLRCEQRSQPRPWSLNLFAQELASPGRCYVIARRAGVREVLGHAGAIHVAGEGHVATIGVDPAWRRHGIGRRLLVAITRGMIGLGAEAMTLEVRASNAAAQAMYRRFGYAPVGVRANYYSDVGEDAIIMWVHDIGEPPHAERLARLERLERLEPTDDPSAAGATGTPRGGADAEPPASGATATSRPGADDGSTVR